MSNTMDAVISLAISLALGAFFLYTIASTPEVIMSWSTKKCVKVQPKTSGSCDNLPERYSTVWVK